MSCTLTVDGPCRRTLRFEIERDRFERAVEEGLARVARSARTKGFRAGKVPLDLVRRQHGDQVREDVRRDLMSQAFGEAVREHGLRPVGDPELNLDVLSDEGPGPFTFELSVEVAPDFELAVPEELPVAVRVPDVDDETVENELMGLRRRAATLEAAPEGDAVAEGDVLATTIVYVVDGQELEPREERPVMPERDLVDDFRSEGSGASFVGRRAGDVVEIDVELPGHFEPTAHAGKAARLVATITGHKRPEIPELEGELLARTGCETVDDLRERVRERLGEVREQMRLEQIDRAVDEHLVQAHALELPERMAARAVDQRVHRLAHDLVEQRGLSPEEGHRVAEEQRSQVAEAVHRALRLSFVAGRIATEHGLTATPDEVEARIRAIADEQRANPKKLMQASVREGWYEDVAAQITDEKTRAWLRERATVTETEGQNES